MAINLPSKLSYDVFSKEEMTQMYDRYMGLMVHITSKYLYVFNDNFSDAMEIAHYGFLYACSTFNNDGVHKFHQYLSMCLHSKFQLEYRRKFQNEKNNPNFNRKRANNPGFKGLSGAVISLESELQNHGYEMGGDSKRNEVSEFTGVNSGDIKPVEAIVTSNELLERIRELIVDKWGENWYNWYIELVYKETCQSEIACTLDISQSNVSKKYRKINDYLRKMLRREGLA